MIHGTIIFLLVIVIFFVYNNNRLIICGNKNINIIKQDVDEILHKEPPPPVIPVKQEKGREEGRVDYQRNFSYDKNYVAYDDNADSTYTVL